LPASNRIRSERVCERRAGQLRHTLAVLEFDDQAPAYVVYVEGVINETVAVLQ
jgi:hypothetical protein